MPRSIVSTVLTKWKKFGCITTGKPRLPKLCDRALRKLGRLINQDRRLTLVALVGKFQVHRHTIRRYIHGLRFENRVAPRKPYLSPDHRKRRLAFARKYRLWTAEDWKNIIWTNESSFGLWKDSRRIRVWRKSHEKYAQCCLAPTFKSGRTSLMVWGPFTRFDKSPLVIMSQGERTTMDFVHNVYEGTLSGFYFMHNTPE